MAAQPRAYLGSHGEAQLHRTPDSTTAEIGRQKFGSGSSTFLGFSFVGYGRERGHLPNAGFRYLAERHDKTERAVALYAAGRTQREIARELGLAPSTVNRFLRQSREQG